ncbi:hypothetical protein BBJ28_00009333 [Nothophytophthora sp. Chile5]|nr:hypothetical protein BBJ28_00009333 [Nothophytophthora sp. Chile5]
MFLGVDRPCSVFVCCPNCAQQAKRMTDIRPYESQCLVVADFYLKHPTASSSSGSSTTAAALPLAPATQHVRLDTVSRADEAGDREWTRPSGSVVLLADVGKTTSSVGMMTNSTTDESWAGHESIDGSYAETLSDLNSGEYRFSSGDEGVDDDLEQEKEPEPSPDVLAELLSQRARIGDQLRQVNLAASGQGSWGGERQRIDVGDFTRSDPLGEDAGRVDNSATTPKPNALMERMRALQSTAEQAYAMTQANEEIMKSLH